MNERGELSGDESTQSGASETTDSEEKDENGEKTAKKEADQELAEEEADEKCQSLDPLLETQIDKGNKPSPTSMYASQTDNIMNSKTLTDYFAF